MKKIFFIVASASVLILAISAAYYLIVFLPNKKQVKLESELQQVINKQKNSANETKTEFEACYEQCLELGTLPTDGKCPSGSSLSKRREVTDFHPEVKEGEPWCYVTGGYCLIMCGPKNESGSPAQSSYEVIEPVEGGISLDERKAEKEQECRDEWSEYNTCMNEYNAEMAEYNQCLAEKNDPDSWRYKYAICTKPIKTCFEPFCSY